MNKVILTQEQAESLELTLEKANENKDLALGWISPALHHRKPLNKKFSSLKELSVGEVARALYIGYEVEPEFKVRDWVYRVSDKKIYRVDFVTEEGLVLDDENLWMFNEKGNDYGKHTPPEDVRHATPEEIAEEKERRWWTKHDRDVWELRKRDILKHKRGNKLIEVKKVHNSQYLIGTCTYYKNKEDVKKHYTVICLAENRLDVKDDE